MTNKKSESGFSYIDVLCALVILTVGILAFLSAITGAVVFSNTQEQQMTAKNIVASTLESIISTKETNAVRLGWEKVGNIGSNPDSSGTNQGIFVNGVQPIKSEAGPDQIIGTADDTGTAISGYTREIVIKDECDPDKPSYNCMPAGTSPVKVRSIKVTVYYYVGKIRREESLTTILTEY